MSAKRPKSLVGIKNRIFYFGINAISSLRDLSIISWTHDKCGKGQWSYAINRVTHEGIRLQRRLYGIYTVFPCIHDSMQLWTWLFLSVVIKKPFIQGKWHYLTVGSFKSFQRPLQYFLLWVTLYLKCI